MANITDNVVVGLQKFKLRNLIPDVSNALIIGIIIGKRQARILANANSTRAVWNCTLRDSLYDYINLTYWGAEDLICPLSEEFQIGDIIEVICPKVSTRSVHDVSEQYDPNVTSPFKLILGEQSKIRKHETDEFNKMCELLHYPTKPLVTFITLNDVQNYNNVKDIYLNLLVAVRTVGQVRYVKLRTGNQQQVRDIFVFDHTCPAFKISLWDPDLISRAAFWKSRSTILFMVDMRPMWNNFFRCVTGGLTSKTIVTENPVGYEAEMLRKYALIAPLQASSIIDKMTSALPDPSTIQNVMTVDRIVSKTNAILNANNGDAEEQKFTALLYATVTDFDLDGLSRVTMNRCGHCKKLISSPLTACDDQSCPMSCGDETPEVETLFDIRVTLTDHTGSLSRCRLNGTTAEAVLHCTVISQRFE